MDNKGRRPRPNGRDRRHDRRPHRDGPVRLVRRPNASARPDASAPPPADAPRWAGRAVRELERLDGAVYAAVATVPTPSLDLLLARLSDAADHAKIWMVGAGLLAVTGGPRGRRTALVAVASVGVSSLVSNVIVKGLLPRRRPDRSAATVPPQRWVPMPRSGSFPSGHSASAFAFATAVGSALPPLSLPLHLAATAVAYSRVHTGVHYPADAITGALLGSATATAVRALLRP